MSARITLILATLEASLAFASHKRHAGRPRPACSTRETQEQGCARSQPSQLTSSPCRFAALEAGDHRHRPLGRRHQRLTTASTVSRRNPNSAAGPASGPDPLDKFHVRLTHSHEHRCRLVDQEHFVHDGDRPVTASIFVESREGSLGVVHSVTFCRSSSEQLERYHKHAYLRIELEEYQVGSEFSLESDFSSDHESLA